ncbi:MAG TPA: ATP-binding cassette domain-containing protein, partial [Trichococcus flocculiformis]|nr:ATP-binding cassette domain-containing protein [Trichococcus flocculiformis]
MDYIDVQHLSFYYDDEPVLQDITFQVHEGEFVILTGENGAAKSTLLKSILGLLN